MRLKILFLSTLLLPVSNAHAYPVFGLPAEEGETRMYADDRTGAGTSDTELSAVGADDDERSLFLGVLLYLPNRALDLIDIVRLRGRVGPGVAAGFRVTRAASMYAGSYASVYAGLPGPRSRKTPKSPIGLESLNGASLSVLDLTSGLAVGPEYTSTEVGVSVQALLVGADVGFDPIEILDFLAGFLTIDIRDDDL